MPAFFLATWASRLGLMKKHQITKSMLSEHAVVGILAIPPFFLLLVFFISLYTTGLALFDMSNRSIKKQKNDKVLQRMLQKALTRKPQS